MSQETASAQTPQPLPAFVAAKLGAGEAKGRGAAVFNWVMGMPTPLAGAEGNRLVSAGAGAWRAPLTGRERRLILLGHGSEFFADVQDVRALLDGLVLPAYRRRLPIYLLTPLPLSFFEPRSHVFDGSRAAADTALAQLAAEQLFAILSEACVIFPDPQALSILGGTAEPPMTPIERRLADALTRRGIPFEAQAPLGPYRADFLLTAERQTDGLAPVRLCVEADGRAFHEDGKRDAQRDAALVSEHGVPVLRFTGSRIWADADGCAAAAEARLRHFSETTSVLTDSASPLGTERLPAPLPALSNEQEQCLTPREGVVLALAPAGSGKTRVLTRRVVEAVRAGIPQERILCVVFNSDAANVMRRRIHGDHGLPDVAVRTLHSIGLEIARKGAGSRFAGFSLADTKALGRGGLSGLYRDVVADDIQAEKDRAGGGSSSSRRGSYGRRSSSRPFVPEEVAAAYEEYDKLRKLGLIALGKPVEMDPVEGFDLARAARVCAAVNERLAERRLLTYDDMVFGAAETLLTSPTARQHYQAMHDCLLVDEYQDLSPAQLLLVRLLALPQYNLFAVGDDDQMINGFAGADPRNIRAFKELFGSARIHTLGENFRCAPTIVRRSANLISHNFERAAKDIRPALDGEGKPRPEPVDAFRIYAAGSAADGAREAARTLRAWHEREGVAYRDMAVLVRVKTFAAFIQIALKVEGIPFEPLEKAAFYTAGVGALIGAYLRAVRDGAAARPDDLAEALMTPTRYVSRDAATLAVAGGLDGLRSSSHVPSHSQKPVAEFCDALQRAHAYTGQVAVNPGSGGGGQRKTSSDVLAFLLTAFGLGEHYRKLDRNSSVGSGGGGGTPATESLALIAQFAVEHPDFDEFVDWFTDQQRAERESAREAAFVGGETDKRRDAVVLSTVHSSKGDEYQAVVLFHAVEGVMPHALAVKNASARSGGGKRAALEEERRITYVGLTRATDRLLVTTDRQKPSRFLAETEASHEDKEAATQAQATAVEAARVAAEERAVEAKREGSPLMAIRRFFARLLGKGRD